jgi:hypothetical protein
VSDGAKQDVPPPRYEQVGGWKHLICDEQEWLARPAAWGIDKLPVAVSGRKQNLFNAHYYGWLAEFVQCSECRPQVQRLFTDESALIDERAVAEWKPATHAPETCDADPFHRCVRNYHRGVVTYPELFNRAVDALFSLADQLDRKDRAPYRWQLRKLKERELTLELVGPNPFRPITFSPSWRTDTAMSLAHTMYESREFGAMPILADALQDAGCDNDAILSHCRDTSATHVRGCWVTDLVLGKE